MRWSDFCAVIFGNVEGENILHIKTTFDLWDWLSFEEVLS